MINEDHEDHEGHNYNDQQIDFMMMIIIVIF